MDGGRDVVFSSVVVGGGRDGSGGKSLTSVMTGCEVRDSGDDVGNQEGGGSGEGEAGGWICC